jgi:hypothetical protein
METVIQVGGNMIKMENLVGQTNRCVKILGGGSGPTEHASPFPLSDTKVALCGEMHTLARRADFGTL